MGRNYGATIWGCELRMGNKLKYDKSVIFIVTDRMLIRAIIVNLEISLVCHIMSMYTHLSSGDSGIL